MLRLALCVPILAILLAAATAPQTKDEPKEKKVGLVKGQDLPGTFHPYNVTGERARRYHCLVTQSQLDPLVMIFVRNLDYPETLKSLEEALDNRIVKNPNVRLNSFTVFLRDKLANQDDDDDELNKQADDIDKKATASNLKKVVFCLENKTDPDLEKYALDENAWITIVVVKRYKVVSVRTLSQEKLTPEVVTSVIDEVADQFGATKK